MDLAQAAMSRNGSFCLVGWSRCPPLGGEVILWPLWLLRVVSAPRCVIVAWLTDLVHLESATAGYPYRAGHPSMLHQVQALRLRTGLPRCVDSTTSWAAICAAMMQAAVNPAKKGPPLGWGLNS